MQSLSKTFALLSVMILNCVAAYGAETNPVTSGDAPTIHVQTVTAAPGGSKPIRLDARYTVINDAITPKAPLTMQGAVVFAEDNYPAILKARAQFLAARENVKVQRINEYMPDSLFQYQEFFASHNQFTGTYYGSPVFPGISGPGFNNNTMTPNFSALGGFSLDWAPLDFGLHKARIDVARMQALQAGEGVKLTKLDLAAAVAAAFLDTAVAIEQVTAARENVASFEKFNSVVQAQIGGSLKPAADGYLSKAQLANAQNDLIRANLSYEIALAKLSTAIGLGGRQIPVDAKGLATTDEPVDEQPTHPVFDDVPIVSATRANLFTAIQEKKVLDKEYFPVLHFVGGANVRGSGLDSETGTRNNSWAAAGTVPTKPNYQVALIVNWNFLDIFRLRAEKKVQVQRIRQQQQDYRLVLQNLRGQDAESRAKVRAAVALAQNMPIQVQAAAVALKLSEARYSTGLGSVAQVAEAAQVLANSRVKQATARIGVWKGLLETAYVHGDLKPFLAEAEHVQRGL